MKPLREMIKEVNPDFFKELDTNLLLFAREIRKELRNEGHVVIGITGYPGKGKSNLVAVLGALIDKNYSLDGNICFIPTAKEIEQQYMNLPKFSFFHIDEASRGLHKHKWHDKVQQKLNELYDTEREGHFLCTALIMPRFNNFTENFRNFMITYWVDIPAKGIAVFYKKDEDKDTRDPWHMDENYKAKLKKWRGKRVFERGLGDRIRAEQITDCYWFYCEVPPVPKEVWGIYQDLKKQSRIQPDEPEVGERPGEAKKRAIAERQRKVAELYSKGHKAGHIAVMLGMAYSLVLKDLALVRAAKEVEGWASPPTETDDSYLFKPIEKVDLEETKQS